MRILAVSATLLCLTLASCAGGPGPAGEATLAQADAEFLRENFSQAVLLYERTLPRVAAANRASVLAQIGKCRMGMGDHAAAVEAFGRGLDQNPGEELRVELHYRRGMAQNNCWKPELAVIDFRRVQQAPADLRGRAVKTEEFLLRLGVTLLRAGSWIEGHNVLEGLVRDHPQGEEAAQARDALSLRQFHIRIARCGDDETARRKAAEASARGLEASVVPAGSSASDRLVLVGRYERFQDAVRDLERVRRLGYQDAYPVP